ncbi:septin-12 [Patagioenas fasciata monilis]|uniref:Septin-12 n=1 Tax=Patagioenas fasciata monilis TaxID=372326 RepID=A0A1V4KT98_PATFA|nr:septin-12 [Patagioenas fasciata monilis]
MARLSVKDHLDGILSDFEALKKSFEAEDGDEMPGSPPVFPLPSGTGECHQPLQPGHLPRSGTTASPSPAPSPVLRSHLSTSLSVSRANGTASTSITRVASFQTRRGFATGPGSDGESLRSSSSSLESPAPPQLPGTPPAAVPGLKKVPSHGSVFPAELEHPLSTHEVVRAMAGAGHPCAGVPSALAWLDVGSAMCQVGTAKWAEPGSSLEPTERSMEPPAVPEEEMMPLSVAPSPAGCQLFGYVGIEAVLDQMKIKTMKTGFEFNIMVVGQSGLGKSTMVNTLFKSKVSRKALQPGQEERIPKTVQLQSVTHVIEEKGVKMKLTVTDTPGFGDQINNENCWDPIIKYINEQYERYLREEILITRKRKIPDTRVHGCVYFIPPTGHWLRPLDLEFMRRLSKIVNVVPVIAKADTLTLDERAEFKQRIQEDLKTHAISVYPQEDFDQDPDDRVLNDLIREKIPFAVVGADQEHQVNGKRVLGRKTKWGIIEVENLAHCEFPLLRDLLIRSHLQDLKDITHNVHYESYRVRRLNESNQPGPSPHNGLPGKGEGGSDL